MSVNLNIMVRGQSNSMRLMEYGGGEGLRKLTDQVELLLGFDVDRDGDGWGDGGNENTVTLLYQSSQQNSGTAYGGTAFLGDWIKLDQNGQWTTTTYEQNLLNYIGNLSPNLLDDPTAVLWLHNEFDVTNPSLTAATWMSGVKYDMNLVRDAFNTTDLSYHFVSAIPYPWQSTGQAHQAIRLGMETLASDPTLDAHIAARALDLNMDFDNTDGNVLTREFGGAHLSDADARLILLRSAFSIAESWMEYALPGSAVYNGNIANAGPEVTAARQTSLRTIQVDVKHDGTSNFASLDADAASGLGWSLSTASGTQIKVVKVSVVDNDTLALTFSSDLPQQNLTLHYGWGYGRLAASDGSGAGNAIYDSAGLPLWTKAAGIDVLEATVNTIIGTRASETHSGGSGIDLISGLAGRDFLFGNDGNDVLIGGAGNDVLTGGAGADAFRFLSSSEGADNITDFVSRLDLIEISASGFGGRLVSGSDLAGTGQFVANTTGRADSLRGTGQFVYETNAGKLWWDVDGVGAQKPALIAVFDNMVTLSASDFWIIS